MRKEIADKKKVPPYIVFSDVALKEMTSQYPQDLDGFRKINGVGEVKLAEYGKLFIEKIIDYYNTNNIESKPVSLDSFRIDVNNQKSRLAKIQEKYPFAYEPWTKKEEQRLISEYNQGKTIKEISTQLGRQPGGIRSRLKKLGIIL